MTTLSSEGYKANQSWQAYQDISTGSEPTDKKMISSSFNPKSNEIVCIKG